MGNSSHRGHRRRKTLGASPTAQETARAEYLTGIIADQYQNVGIGAIDVQWHKTQVLFVIHSADVQVRLPIARQLLLDPDVLTDLQILRLAGLAILAVLQALVDEIAPTVVSLSGEAD